MKKTKTMKKTLAILTFMFIGVIAAFAQTSPTFPYQSVVRNANNRLVQDSTFTLTIEILQNGVSKYGEVRNVRTDHNGMIAFYIGDPTGLSSSWGDINSVTDWRFASIRQTYHLYSGDVVVTDTVAAVPYALQADGGPALTNLINRVNTFNTKVCDTVMACPDIITMRDSIQTNAQAIADSSAHIRSEINTMNSNLLDSISRVSTHSIARDNALGTRIGGLKDSVEHNYVSNNDLCAKVTPCVNEQMQNLRDSVSGLVADTATVHTDIRNLKNDSHTHSNKALLDTYTQTEADLADAVSKKHEHSNKAVLDRTEQAYRSQDSTKLASIATGAEVNVNADWNETNTDTAAYIKNKPTTIAGYGITDAKIENQTITLGDQTITVATANGLKELKDSVEHNYVSNNDLCAKVTPCVNEQMQNLRDSVSGLVADTATVHTDIRNLENASHTHSNKALLDTYTQTEADLADAVSKKHEHSNKAVLDRTEQAYRSQDSTKLASIATGAEVNVNADWNETNTDTAAYIKNKPTIPTTVAQLTDAGDYAKLAGNNNFSGENTFSGDVTFSNTVIVPSGFNFTTTTSETCNNIAVNACDLLAVFDSIQRQFTALRAEIDGLRDSLQDLRGAREPEFSEMVFERAETSLTATATFDDHGATITEYEFCISTSQEMTEPTCQTTTDATYTFSGLNPGTQYYVTVAATNLKGTTTSGAQDVQTVHSAPVLSEPVTATPVSNTEIKVEGELTDMGGSTPTTVTVYAYTSENHSGDEPVASANTELSTTGNYTLNITGLTKGTEYYIDVIADNGEKQDTATASASTLNVRVDVASDNTDTIRTGSNVDVTVNYTATVTDATPDANGYSWKVNGADSTSTSNSLTVHFTESGTYKVVCVVNGVSDTAVTVVVAYDTITFIPNGGTSGTMDKQIVERGVATNLSANQFTHDGNWEFIGWGGCDGSGPIYTDEANITTNGNVTLHAQWHTWCSGDAAENESGNNGIDSVKDHENNWYDVVQIGTQCWLKENMRATSSPTGTTFYNGYGFGDYSPSISSGYSTRQVYTDIRDRGYLYSWQNAMNGETWSVGSTYENHRGICPTGWHIPSDQEWFTLEKNVLTWTGTGDPVVTNRNNWAGAGKLIGGCEWGGYNANTDMPIGSTNLLNPIRNTTGFSALAVGRHYTNNYTYAGKGTYFVTAEADCGRAINDSQDGLLRFDFSNQSTWSSVRCLRNVASECENIVTEEDIEIHGFPYVYGDNDTTFLIGTEDGDYILHRTSTEGCSKTTTLHVKVTCGNNIKDHEGNEYATTYINGVCIMAQNLRCTSSPNGHTLTQWAWCDDWNCPGKTDASLYSKIESLSDEGYLYNWRAAMDTTIDVASIGNEDFSNHRGLCPAGWHLPTKSEWETVVGSIDAGQFAKENSSWNASDVENTPGYTSDPDKNATGFSAIPAGCRFGNTSEAHNLGHEANFWSASSFKTSEYNSEYNVNIPFDLAYVRTLEYNNSIFYEPTFGTSETPNVENFNKSYGASVRCVRNNGGDTPGGGDTPTEFSCGTSVKDVDNNEYHTVQIGNQCWMKENLRTNVNGSVYPQNGETTVTGADTVTYGRLYTWNSMMNEDNSSNATPSGVKGICPEGWHVPSDAEWDTLTHYVFDNEDYKCGSNCGSWSAGTVSCIALALSSSTGWYSTTTPCAPGSSYTVSPTGFDAVPAGGSGNTSFGKYAYFWSASDNTSGALYRRLSNSDAYVRQYAGNKTSEYFSVRCVRDANNE